MAAVAFIEQYVSLPLLSFQQLRESQQKSLSKPSSESFAKGYITEALWGSISAAREISLGRDSRAGSAAEVALSYCEKAADILHEMGCTALNAVEDLFVVGGMENLRAYLSHKITKQEYYDKIVEDLTLDTGMAVLGGIIGAVGGGIGGAEVGAVGGPVGVAAGASKGAALGATKGAAAGYVAARAARAAVNATVNLFKGGSRSGGGKEEPSKNERKTEEVRKSGGNNAPIEKEVNGERKFATSKDADNYVKGLRSQNVLGKKGVTKDGHEFFRFEKKCEYNGIQFRKGDYISRDTLHHEWEWFRGAKNHQGAIDPLTGELNALKRRAERILKLP